MLVLDIPDISFSAGRFIAMMFDKVGLIDKLPEDKLDSYEYIRVVIKNNSMDCMLSKDRNLYEVHWDESINMFTGHTVTGTNRLPVDGNMTDTQCDVLYAVFEEKKSVSKEVKRISMETRKDESGNLVIVPVFENCTLEDFMTSLLVNDNITITDNMSLISATRRDKAKLIIEECEKISSSLYKVRGVVPQYMTIKLGDSLRVHGGQEMPATVSNLRIDGQDEDTVYPGDQAEILINGAFFTSVNKGDYIRVV